MDSLADGGGEVREWGASPVHRLGGVVSALQEGGKARQAGAA